MKIQNKHLKLRDDQRVYFGNSDDASFWFNGSELCVNTTISGISPTADYQLTTKYYVDNMASTCDWQPSVIDKDLTAPPGSPNIGDRYIVGSPATGAWTGHEDDIVEWDGSAGAFVTPDEGYATWVEDENLIYIYDGFSWVTVDTTMSHSNLLDIDADDHTQYVPTDASRGFTATVSGVYPTQDYHLSTKSYVDNVAGGGTKTGRETLLLNDSSKAVTFSSVYADTSYTVSAMMNNTIDAIPSIYPTIVSAKATTGFTIMFSGDIDSANYELEWITIHD